MDYFEFAMAHTVEWSPAKARVPAAPLPDRPNIRPSSCSTNGQVDPNQSV